MVLRNRTALKLVITGVAPQQAYGHQVNDATAAQTQAMRTNLKSATQFGGTYACTATCLTYLFGPSVDPYIKNTTEQLDMWFQTWEKIDAIERKATRVTWATIVGRLLKGETLSCPRGPLEATVRALISLHWQPSAPDRWVLATDLKGNATQWVDLSCGGSVRFQVTAKASNDAQILLWKKAAAHAYGSGLETGIPSLEPAKSTIRSFRKKGFASEAKALETVMVGSYRFDCKEGVVGRCKRCTKVVRLGRKHDFYHCADNDLIDEPAFIKASKRIKRHVEKFDEHQCLWMRGMVPRELLKDFEGPEIHEARIWESTNFGETINRSGIGYAKGRTVWSDHFNDTSPQQRLCKAGN